MRWWVAALAALLGGAAEAPPPRLLGTEHIPVAVADLDAAETQFRALGFTIKPGRTHANGIRNGHAKFADGSYIELITAPAAVDALTRTYRVHLAQGDGPAFVSLHVDREAGLAERLAAFAARAEDGTVTFPDGPLARFFFGMRGRAPTDRPEYYRHANGAEGIVRLWLAPSDPAVERMMTRLGARFVEETVCTPRRERARVAHLPAGDIVLLPRRDQRVPGRVVLGATVRVARLDRVRRVLTAGGAGRDASEACGGLFVAPARANGMLLEFRADARRISVPAS